MTKQYREDVMFRPEDLDSIDSTLYEPKEEELVVRNLINVKTDVDPGAESYSYDVITRRGAAKIIAPGADDVPLVETDLQRHTVQIYSIASAFKIYLQELRAAQKAGRNLDTTKADVARKTIAEKENKLAWVGDDKHNISGLTNATGIQTFTVEEGDEEETEWEDKTGTEIIKDLRQARAKVNKLPGHNADTLVLPPEKAEKLEEPVSEYDTRPIREYLESVGWFDNIEVTTDLEGRGDGDSDCFLVFDSSPEVMELLVPMDITRHDEEYKFPYFKVPVEERTGGVIIRYPMAICRADGIG